MAGLGRKVFNAGEVLSAANVQGYLQDQVVQVYSGTAARSSALGTAVSEGMMSYLTDSNELSVYTSNGTAAWSPVSLQQSGNVILNSAFDIWQRGTSGTASGTSAGSGYNADRWFNYYAGAMTVSRQATGDTTNLPNIQYAARVSRNSGQTSATSIYHAQDIETVNSVPFAGKTVTFSFYARKGANYSGASSNLTFRVQSGTGTDQHILGGYTGSALVVDSTATLTTTWQRFTGTGTVGATATQLGVYFTYDAVGTAGAADYFEITGVQLEAGSVATPFRRSSSTLQGELAACQRYYYRSTGSNFEYQGAGQATATTNAQILIRPPVTMRTNPSSLDYSNVQLTDEVNIYSISSMNIAWGGSGNLVLLGAVTTGLTTYRPCFLRNANNSAGYIGFSAEL